MSSFPRLESRPSLMAAPAAAFLLVVLLCEPMVANRAEASPRYAIVNAGKVDHETTIRLYALYAALAGVLAEQEGTGPAPRATAPRATAPRATAPREAAPRAAAPREAAPRATAPRATAPREAAPRATAPRRAAPRRAAPRRAAPREAAPRRAARQAAPELTPILGRALRRALLGLPHDETLSVVRGAIATGRRLFGALQREDAADALSQAIVLLDRHVNWAQAKSLLVVAHTYLLLCEHELGRREAALATAARLRELTANQRPPGVPEPTWEAYPLPLTPLLPRRTLDVKAPPLSRVYLDDQLAGTGPIVLSVGPGVHRVRVELVGHRLFFQEVAASEGNALVLVSLMPEPEDPFGDVRASLAALRKSGKPFEPQPYRAFAKLVSVDFLLVAVREGEQVRLRFFSRKLGRFTGASFLVALPGPGVDPKPLAATIRGVFQRAREEAREDAELAAKAADKGRQAKKTAKPSMWKKWYFWVAAAVVVGVVAAFAIKDSLDEDKVILKITRP